MSMSQNMNLLTRRRFVELLAAAGVAATGTVALGGCAQQEEGPKPADGQAPETVSGTVVDAKGNEFAIPESVERIAITCNGGTTHEVAIFGAADKIVAQPSMKKFPQLLKMYPQFNDVVNAGSFDDLNIEALVATEPDVAAAAWISQCSCQHKIFNDNR